MTLRRHGQIMAVVQGGIFLIVSGAVAAFLLFPYFAEGDRLSVLAALAYIASAGFFGALIAAYGAVNTARQDYLAGRLKLTDKEREKGERLGAPRRPLWLGFLFEIIIQTILVNLVAGVVIFALFYQGMLLSVFVVVAAGLVAAQAGLAAWRHSGRQLLKFIAHPASTPEAFLPYALREHCLGNALINYGINALIGYVLFHPGPRHAGPLAEIGSVILDLLIMSLAIGLLVPIGVELHSSADLHENRVLPLSPIFSRPPPLILRWLLYLLVSLLPFLVVAALLLLLHLPGLSLLSVLTLKGFLAALQGGAVALFAAFLTAKSPRAGHARA